MQQDRVVVFCDDDAGEFFLRLSRLRRRPDRIARCDPGGGSLLTKNIVCGETPTPTLPRKREREPC
ncbi:hypothetical protein CK489_21710, partial [Bradyrhizobium sp. UFLA03-84]